MSTYTAYCGRRELLTSDNFADAMTAADQCLETAPASLVHIRRSTDGRSVKAGIAGDYFMARWTPDAIYGLLGLDLDGVAL
jgi:hypothetical protein